MTQKEKIKHERVLKLKKIGFWTLNIISYILAGIFLIVLIISLSNPKKQNVSPRSAYKLYENEITEVIRVDSPNNVSYDDEEYKITLTADELNSYTWQNFYNYLSTDNNYQNVSFSDEYTDYDTDIADQDGAYIYQDSEGSSIIFLYDYEQYNLANGTSYDKNYVIFNDNPPFTISLNIVCTDSNYNDVKNSIQLDISANSPSETQTIFDSITQVLTNFITTLNSGVTAVINLFWNSTTSQLTLLGNLTTIVIGVAVCFFLFRLVIGLIRLRG